MGRSNAAVTAIVERFRGRELDAHYFAYFECFNEGLFFEAHEVLEKLWLPERKEPNGLFYKGLIQLAGAFVHLQKNRLRPAGALFKLAQANLRNYPPLHQRLPVHGTLALIDHWLARLKATDFAGNPLSAETRPRLDLSDP